MIVWHQLRVMGSASGRKLVGVQVPLSAPFILKRLTSRKPPGNGWLSSLCCLFVAYVSGVWWAALAIGRWPSSLRVPGDGQSESRPPLGANDRGTADRTQKFEGVRRAWELRRTEGKIGQPAGSGSYETKSRLGRLAAVSDIEAAVPAEAVFSGGLRGRLQCLSLRPPENRRSNGGFEP